MAMTIGRKMTKQDEKKLEAAAKRFCKKYNLDTDVIGAIATAQGAADNAAYPEIARDMRNDWNRRVKRALGGYTTWGYGYVGYPA